VKYKLVIFDFDGTLADSFPWFIGIFNEVAEKYKFTKIEKHEVDTLRGYNARMMIQHLGVPFWKMPLIGNHIRGLMARDISQIRLFDGVDRLLRRLSEHGVTLALVTSNSYENVRRVLGPENAALITYYECGASVFGKHTRFRKILRKSGISPGETLCIGDEIRDIEAARKEDLAFGAVAWGFTNVASLQAHAPTEVFTTIDDIVDTVVQQRL
jgi:phosphoglycolate phosphatase